MVPNYFSKSQNLFRIICISKNYKTVKYETADRWNSKKNVTDLKTFSEFTHFITMQVYFASLGPRKRLRFSPLEDLEC